MRRFRALALLLVTSLLAGCFFEHPLTDRPSKDINTWLLGVWEHNDDKGHVYRAGVTPLTASRYAVWFQSVGKTPKESKRWDFEAWISRVGNSVFLTFKCLKSAGEVPVDAYVFAHYQVMGQNEVVLRPLQMDSDPGVSSFKLREEVRRKLKDRSLLPLAGTGWTRISEIYWEPGDAWTEQPPQPLRYPESVAAPLRRALTTPQQDRQTRSLNGEQVE